MLVQDHIVGLKTRETISAIASSWRERAGIDDHERVDIISFLNWLKLRYIRSKGYFVIRLFDKSYYRKSAYVTYKPFVLSICEETFGLAGLGDPDSIFIIAHEIGHIILHDNEAKAYSIESVDYNKFGLEDTSAEWQADFFAESFLVPEYIQARFRSADQLILNCAIGRDRAETLWKARPKCKGALKPYEGEACSRCAGFALVRMGLSLVCEACGTRTYD